MSPLDGPFGAACVALAIGYPFAVYARFKVAEIRKRLAA